MATKWIRGCALADSFRHGMRAETCGGAACPASGQAERFVLLPEPEGESSGIVVKNQAGSQDLTPTLSGGSRGARRCCAERPFYARPG